MLLDLLAQLGDQALAGFGEKLREGERGDALNQCRAKHGEHQRRQQRDLMLAYHVIDQEPGGIRQHQPAEAVDDHQAQAERQQFAPRQDHLAQIGPDFADAFGLLALGGSGLFARMLARGRSFDGVGMHYNFSVA